MLTSRACSSAIWPLPLLLLATTIDAADLSYPLDVTANGRTVYIADRNLPGIWEISDDRIVPYFKAPKKFRSPLNAVRCIALDRAGKLLAGDSATRDVYRFDDRSSPAPLTNGSIGIPAGIAVSAENDIYVSDLELHRIWRIPRQGNAVVFASVRAPRGICFDDRQRLWVVSHSENQLLRWDAEGNRDVVVAGRPFKFPHGVAVDDEGAAYVSDGYAKSIWRVPAGGKPTRWLTDDKLINPVGIAWHDGALLIADSHAKAIFRADVRTRSLVQLTAAR